MKELWYQGRYVLAVSSYSASWEWAYVFESLFDQMAISKYYIINDNMNNNFDNNIIIK